MNISDVKKEYENIEIPEELEFIVRKSIKEGKRNKVNKKIKKLGICVGTFIICFVGVVNISKDTAEALSKVPGLKGLIDFVTSREDKGKEQAINKGLVQEVNYSKEMDGVKIKLNSVIGDYKQFWFNLSIDGGTIKSGRLIDESRDNVIYRSTNINEEGSIRGGFEEKLDRFKLEVYVANKEAKEVKFIIPIELNENMKNSKSNIIEVDNRLSTNIGDIEILSIESSNTRIKIDCKLNSDKYHIYRFENPRLIDEEGNIYKESSFYSRNENGDIRSIEFEGEFVSGKRLDFYCDEVYYGEKNRDNIIVDLEKRLVKDNIYGFEIKDISNKGFKLVSNKVYDLIWAYDVENKNFKVTSVSRINNKYNEFEELELNFELNKNHSDRLEIKLGELSSGKIDGFKFNIIE